MAGHSKRNDRSANSPEVECPEPVEGLFWVYILQCQDNSFYVGYSNDVTERLRKHRYGLGSKHTRDRKSPRLVYAESLPDRNRTVRREAQIKRWSHAKKAALIHADLEELKRLSRAGNKQV